MPGRNQPTTQDENQTLPSSGHPQSPLGSTIPATPTPQVPYRQIRALYDDETITVYQAYQASIAIPAVKEQKLSASKDFVMGRMTWIKPSWCWMMYIFFIALTADFSFHKRCLPLPQTIMS
jgi:hypothetical protein